MHAAKHHRKPHKPTRKPRRGFTLIEIVLVLAIAGLLLVIVFAAVSNAQKSRRDAQRKRDLAAFVAAGGLYAANHRLMTPDDQAELDDLVVNYFGSHKDPLLGTAYVGDFWNRGASHDLGGSLPAMGHIAFVLGHECSPSGSVDLVQDPPAYSFTTKIFAAVIRLETGYYCLSGDN